MVEKAGEIGENETFGISVDVVARMEVVPREVCRGMVENAMLKLQESHITSVAVADEKIPPEPITRKGVKGRKETRSYKRLTVGIDVILAERFVEEAKKQNLSPGKLFHVILWNRYGKPQLSYMEGDEPSQA
jgi:hypothetical protein